MSTNYYEKQEKRLERAAALAEKARAEASSRFNSPHLKILRDMGGEPVKIGHHSEKRHRRLIENADKDMQKGCEAVKKSEHYDRKAAVIERTLTGKGAISSDAPDALERLREKLEKLEGRQAHMKAVNAVVRAKPRGEATLEKLEKLEGLGFTESSALQAFKPDYCGRVGFPAYALTNNNANVRRIKERIAQLKQLEGAENVEEEVGGVRLVENAEENRIQIIFPGKPEPETRSMLKANGFRWAPSAGAWQRHLNNAGRYAAKCVLEKLEAKKA